MRPLRSLLLACLLAFTACADGGSRGSGITTAQGNVSSVQTALRLQTKPRTLFARLMSVLQPIAPAFARSEVEGIRVDVEGTGSSGQTDAAGLFVVSGSFGGSVTLHFQRADDNLDARLTIQAPPGGTVTLANVRLDSGGGASVERRDVSFGGTVSATNCGSQQITVVTSSGSGSSNVFTVKIGGASIHDDDGNPLACGNIRAGSRADVAGSFDDDGTIRAADVEIRTDSSGSGDDDGGDDDGDDHSGPGGDGSNSGPGSDSSGPGSGGSDSDNSGPGSGSSGSGSSGSGSGSGDDSGPG